MRASALLTILVGVAASAQINPPQNSEPAAPTPKIVNIPAARDVPYTGTIQLSVDATDTVRAIFNVHEHVPVAAPGDFVLLYPQWLPGHHNKLGEIRNVAGLRFTANGQPLRWVRDPLDVYAFHLTVPDGVSAIDAEFQLLSPTATNQGRIAVAPQMENIDWIALSLYPAGYYVRDIPVQASVRVPAGWKVASALRPVSQSGNRIDYPTTSYEILTDSPLMAGAHYRQFPLGHDVNLDVLADDDAELAATPGEIALHQQMVDQAIKLFGARHFDHYDFLLTLSRRLGSQGLEHHRSSEDATSLGYFTDWQNQGEARNLLPHEFTHSWNGKFRRPADLWTPDFRTPMEGSLLWVYEGQTQFWGYVLGARSGMLSKEETLQALASFAAEYSEGSPGRSWRPLIDTTKDPILAERKPLPWESWQRSEDFYTEGMLVWLDVDRIIRELSGGKRSLDDFARAFFGMRDGDYGVLTYTLGDVVGTLNRIQPYDWRSYFQRRVYEIAPEAPLEGITKGGYNLVYTDKPTAWTLVAEKRQRNTDLSYSGGLVVNAEGIVNGVIWKSAAFDAGLTVGSQILTVNNRTFSRDTMTNAIAAAKGTDRPIQLLVNSGGEYRTVELNWHGGLRYPRLVKAGSGDGTLDALLAPR
ncbi:MAG TPA: peptidase M61 [Sphingomicrobium sp.]|nr:peptidase M61 [Sphingomicrobium sp.]